MAAYEWVCVVYVCIAIIFSAYEIDLIVCSSAIYSLKWNSMVNKLNYDWHRWVDFVCFFFVFLLWCARRRNVLFTLIAFVCNFFSNSVNGNPFERYHRKLVVGARFRHSLDQTETDKRFANKSEKWSFRANGQTPTQSACNLPKFKSNDKSICLPAIAIVVVVDIAPPFISSSPNHIFFVVVLQGHTFFFVSSSFV